MPTLNLYKNHHRNIYLTIDFSTTENIQKTCFTKFIGTREAPLHSIKAAISFQKYMCLSTHNCVCPDNAFSRTLHDLYLHEHTLLRIIN